MNNIENKTVSIYINEFQTNIIKVIEESHLPFSICKLVLDNIMHEVQKGARQEYEADLQKYNSQQEEINNEHNI